MERVVADVATETNLRVVRCASGTREHALHLLAEVALDLEDETANLALGIAGLPAQELVGVREHARGGLSRADGADHHHARVEPALRNREPRGLRRAPIRGLEMSLTKYERGVRSPFRRDVGRQRALLCPSRSPIRDDRPERTKHRCCEERCAEPERRVAVRQHQERSGIPQFDDLQIHIAPVDRISVDTGSAHTQGDQHCDDDALFHQHPDHGGLLSRSRITRERPKVRPRVPQQTAALLHDAWSGACGPAGWPVAAARTRRCSRRAMPGTLCPWPGQCR